MLFFRLANHNMRRTELCVSEEKTKLSKLALVLLFLKLYRLGMILTDIIENYDELIESVIRTKSD